MNTIPGHYMPNRIIIIGCGGSGKSTLAIKLGERLGLPVIHLDRLFWQPGWVSIPREELAERIKEMVGRPRWIIDGNYSATLDLRLAASDLVIFLDMPRWLCLWNVVKRRWMFHHHNRPDMTEGCPEQLNWEFLRWIWHFNRDKQPGILAGLATLRKDQISLILKSPRQVRKFLDDLRP